MLHDDTPGPSARPQREAAKPKPLEKPCRKGAPSCFRGAISSTRALKNRLRRSEMMELLDPGVRCNIWTRKEGGRGRRS